MALAAAALVKEKCKWYKEVRKRGGTAMLLFVVVVVVVIVVQFFNCPSEGSLLSM